MGPMIDAKKESIDLGSTCDISNLEHLFGEPFFQLTRWLIQGIFR